MPESNARVSLAITAQVRQDGVFPSFTTYPASFERYLVNGTQGQTISKVYAVTGTIGDDPVSLPVSGTLTKVKLWYIENTLAVGGTASDVVVTGGPVNGTIPRGQCILATNDFAGWTAGTVTLAGTSGAAYKVIALGN